MTPAASSLFDDLASVLGRGWVAVRSPRLYLHQIERLTSALDAAGVEALVASSVANVAYVTGFRSLTHALLHTPQFAVFTRRGTAPVCGGPASFICEPQIEALWAKHQASIDPAERERLSKEIQRIVVEQYYLVPLYLNPFVHAVGPKVLREGEAVHRYWDTLHAPFPWPWEIWEVKG